MLYLMNNSDRHFGASLILNSNNIDIQLKQNTQKKLTKKMKHQVRLYNADKMTNLMNVHVQMDLDTS